MKKSEFLTSVAQEIEGIKNTATKEELERLDISRFNPENASRCIYGLITGDCLSERAKEIMDASCVRMCESENGASDFVDKSFTASKSSINGEYDSEKSWKGLGDSYWSLRINRFTYLSALEAYICMKGAKVAHIIKYLRGEVDALEL
ncbi:MAG: hypothetical protein KDH96_05190 [Candidatus Riesia sp.]|nr:hypothetical protein [Candidatus Riesia sp.]